MNRKEKEIANNPIILDFKETFQPMIEKEKKRQNMIKMEFKDLDNFCKTNSCKEKATNLKDLKDKLFVVNKETFENKNYKLEELD